MNIKNIISNRVYQALVAVGAKINCKPQVRQSTKVNFGDYQVDGIMKIAKELNVSPQFLAKRVLSNLDLVGIAKKIQVVAPGFINIFLDPFFIAKSIDDTLKSTSLGISKPIVKQTIVVDYSAPNVAKEMHVGHLRSTIIGDAVVRTLELLGHKVIRANHIGDWGTQFGMLIAFLEKENLIKNINNISLSDLESFYRKAKKYYEKDKNFAKCARSYVVKLQDGNKELLNIWQKLVDITISKNQIIYNRLNVKLTSSDIMGESSYNPMLPAIIEDLKIKGLAVKSQGAIVVFLDEFKNKNGKPMGIIIQKEDGGYLYTTTDIACAKYRYEILHADRVLYYTDSRQQQHLMQVWAIVRKAGYVPDYVSLEHHMFGMMLNKKGKPFKTSTGETIKLEDLLNEALIRTRNLIISRNPNMPADKLEKLTKVISIGAIKYADLSKNRITNYIFDWDNMLTLNGNTAPYMQYAYARILSIFRKAEINNNLKMNSVMTICVDQEIKLSICLLQFEEILDIVAQDGTPHIMCSYLYNLASLFSNFYECCPIINAENDAIRNSRLKLAKLTAKTIRVGLNTLGIETLEYM